jgi:hypothetical protein
MCIRVALKAAHRASRGTRPFVEMNGCGGSATSRESSVLPASIGGFYLSQER